MNRGQIVRRIRLSTAVFLLGLVLSGLSAIPIVTAFDLAERSLGPDFGAGGKIPVAVSNWLATAYRGVKATEAQAPFVFYGTDWLAFGHLVIALSFVGAWRDPVRNQWLFRFGLLSCGLVVPWALVFGAVRGIPLWWRVIDCSFGLAGAVPLWLCLRWTRQLEQTEKQTP